MKINNEIYYGLRGIANMPEYISYESIEQLKNDGIDLVRANYRLTQYIVDINSHINNKINNCKNIFPIWLNWDFIKELFIMPNGTREDGIKLAASAYYANMNNCPYQVYINWPNLESGNIVLNDKKFVTSLYASHNTIFKDLAKVTDASLKTKSGIHKFIEESKCSVFIVDCENSDPFKFYAMLKNLEASELLDRVVKIVFFDDIHTTTAWKIINEFTQIKIEHITLERVKNDKSFLDVQLTARAAKEHYKNNVDSFLLVSSDSDYWGLISEIDDAKFLVMIEQNKCSPALKATLNEHGITYCSIDEFCTGSSYEIKEQAVLAEIRAALARECCFNINDIVDTAFKTTRADMTTGEYKQFIKKHISPMHLRIDANGDAFIELGSES